MMALVVKVVVFVVVVLGEVKVVVGVAVAIVVGMLYFILVWLVVFVYQLPVPVVCSDGFDGGDHYGSIVAGCCSGSWVFSLQNCGNLQMSAILITTNTLCFCLVYNVCPLSYVGSGPFFSP